MHVLVMALSELAASGHSEAAKRWKEDLYINAMSAEKKQIPAVEGWFTWPSEEPHLIGTTCKSCGDYFFPKASACRNPNCMGTEVEEALLSRRGTLWSYTINHYPPPPPYRAADPFVPYGIAVVELAEEGIRVEGQVAAGCDLKALKIGMEMELVIEKIYEDEQGNEVVAWKFRPVQS